MQHGRRNVYYLHKRVQRCIWLDRPGENKDDDPYGEWWWNQEHSIQGGKGGTFYWVNRRVLGKWSPGTDTQGSLPTKKPPPPCSPLGFHLVPNKPHVSWASNELFNVLQWNMTGQPELLRLLRNAFLMKDKVPKLIWRSQKQCSNHKKTWKQTKTASSEGEEED